MGEQQLDQVTSDELVYVPVSEFRRLLDARLPSHDTAEAFAAETTAFLESLRKSPIAPGFDKVRIAGEPEREMRARRERGERFRRVGGR